MNPRHSHGFLQSNVCTGLHNVFVRQLRCCFVCRAFEFWLISNQINHASRHFAHPFIITFVPVHSIYLSSFIQFVHNKEECSLSQLTSPCQTKLYRYHFEAKDSDRGLLVILLSIVSFFIH